MKKLGGPRGVGTYWNVEAHMRKNETTPDGAVISTDAERSILPRGSVHASDLCAFLGVELSIDGETPCYYTTVEPGQVIYTSGDRTDTLYIVASGMVKTTADGNINGVNGVLLPGDMLGVESIAYPGHVNTAIAMSRALILNVPRTFLMEFCIKHQQFESALITFVAAGLYERHSIPGLLRNADNGARVAFLLLWLAAKAGVGTIPAPEVDCVAVRGDIASYLGMSDTAFMTVLEGFLENGMLEFDSRHIRIRNAPRMRSLCTGPQIGYLSGLDDAAMTGSRVRSPGRSDGRERREDHVTSDIVHVGVLYMKVFGQQEGRRFLNCAEIAPWVVERVVVGNHRRLVGR